MPHSVWLCPEAEQGRPLVDAITGYAQRFGTPAFEPHVTLLGDLLWAPQVTVAACRSVLTHLLSTTGCVSRVSQTTDYFMSLFLDVDIAAPVATARAELAAALSIDALQPFRPHLSLAYGLSAEEPGQKAVQELSDRFVGQTLKFNDIKIVHSAKKVAIENWRTIHVERLK